MPRVFIIDDLLGKGTFGQVAKCHKENTSEYFAIKVLIYYTISPTIGHKKLNSLQQSVPNRDRRPESLAAQAERKHHSIMRSVCVLVAHLVSVPSAELHSAGSRQGEQVPGDRSQPD